MSAGLAKSTGYIGESLAKTGAGKALKEFFTGKKADILEPTPHKTETGNTLNIGMGSTKNTVGNYNPITEKQYAQYRQEEALSKLSKEFNEVDIKVTQNPKAKNPYESTTPTTPKIKEEPAKLGTVKEESPKIGSNLSGTTSKISNGKILGAVGLTGAVATAGTFLGLNYLPSIFDPNGGEGGGDPSIIEKIKEVFSELIGGEGGGTYYLEGDPYGESGSVTVLDETVETLKEYAPYLIGFGVIVVIVALVTGNRKGKGKKGGNRK